MSRCDLPMGGMRSLLIFRRHCRGGFCFASPSFRIYGCFVKHQFDVHFVIVKLFAFCSLDKPLPQRLIVVLHKRTLYKRKSL